MSIVPRVQKNRILLAMVLLSPLSTIELEFNFEWLEDWNTASFDLIWKTNHGFFTNKVVPDLKIYPLGMWSFNGDYDDPKVC